MDYYDTSIVMSVEISYRAYSAFKHIWQLKAKKHVWSFTVTGQ